jgi:hypothetical protein
VVEIDRAMVTPALRQAFDGRVPKFMLRGMPLVADGGRAFTREDWLELQRERFPSTGKPAQDGQSPPEGHHLAPEPETAVREAPVAFAPGVGMRLHHELKALVCERQACLERWPDALPLAAPVEGAVLAKGVCTRAQIDLEHTLLMPNALHWESLPPLRLRHGSEPVGEILALEYSAAGDELRIECRIDDCEAARMPAFSVCFTPETYELIDRGGRNFFFKVTRARLDEVSLTPDPALRSALVTARTPVTLVVSDPRYQKLADQMARLRLALAA